MLQPLDFAMQSGTGTDGNDGRGPYYRCQVCNKWMTWADRKGISASNSRCFYNLRSREDKNKDGVTVWQCWDGTCLYLVDINWVRNRY